MAADSPERTHPVLPGAAAQANNVTAADTEQPVAQSQSVDASDVPPLAATAPVSSVPETPLAIPDAPRMSGRLSSAVDLVKPITGGTPVLPTNSPLDWTLLAFTRRESAAATLRATSLAPAAVPAAAAVNTGLIMGPSGVPIPSSTYINNVFNLYVQPNSPAGTVPQVVFTPEGLYPITGVKSLPLNTSGIRG